ncbi:MAG: HPP family protein, partial [Polyangiaceae bacterium]|nr:HPP family protein [Polyangiaceae bacterium]
MSLSRIEDERQRLLLGGAGTGLFLLALGAIDLVTRGAVGLSALVPPFGAAVVIVFFTPETASARPWNVVVGQIVSTLVACGVLSLLPSAPSAVLAALAVTSSVFAMIATRSFHP